MIPIIVIDALAGDGDVRQLVAELTVYGVSISSVTQMEVNHGLLLKGPDMTRDRFDQMLREVPVIPFW